MKVAMNAPDEAAAAALEEERPDARVGVTARMPQRRHLGGRKEIGRAGELGVMLRDIVADRVDPRLRLHPGGLWVGGPPGPTPPDRGGLPRWALVHPNRTGEA